MTVYVVSECDYESSHVIGIYTDLRKAQQLSKRGWNSYDEVMPRVWFERASRRKSLTLKIEGHEVIE